MRRLSFFNPYLSVWFHAACYDVLENSYKPSKKPTFEELERFADATRPAYKPQLDEHRQAASALEGLFSKHTRCIIQGSFRQELLGQLPVEVIIIIFELIVPCWYLIVLGETRRLIELLREDRESQCSKISLTREIWMSWVNYRGISYAARFSNKPLESIDPTGQYHIRLPRKIKRIAQSVDYIGLRGIQFIDQHF